MLHRFVIKLLVVLLAQTALFGITTRETASPSPQRIISTAPSITEMIYALDQQDRLVGVTSYCDYPPEAQKKTIIGDFASPNLETMLRLRPDLIVLLSDRGDILDKLRSFDIPTLVLTQDTLEDIFNSIRRLADRIGCPEKGQKLADRLRSQLDGIRNSPTTGPQPRVLFIVSRTPGSLNEIYTVSRTCYIGQLIELAGGSNVFAEARGIYPKVSVEEILARNPDIIIDMSMGGAETDQQAEQVRKLWEAFPDISATRSGRIFALDSDVFIIPGPRVVQAAQRLAEIFRH